MPYLGTSTGSDASCCNRPSWPITCIHRWRSPPYEDLIARDKVSLDLFWLRDDSLEDIDNLPPPAVLAAEIAEDLQSALTEIQALTESLTAGADPPTTDASTSPAS